MNAFAKGDFVWFQYDTKEMFPGRIVDIQKDDYYVEICVNKKKSMKNDVEIMVSKKHQLKIRLIGI